MKFRPQSAVTGKHQFNLNSSTGDDAVSSVKYYENDRRQSRKNLKTYAGELKTNDYSRILPKNIYQDKERLYSETLQLKECLNLTKEENLKLKTRVTILEKEKQKMAKTFNFSNKQNNLNARMHVKLRLDSSLSSQKQSTFVKSLKELLRTANQQIEQLKSENSKIKKISKYTAITELQLQRKLLQEQISRLNCILNQFYEERVDTKGLWKEIDQLRKGLAVEMEANRVLNEDNQKLAELLQQMEEQVEKQKKRADQRQRKLKAQVVQMRRSGYEHSKKSSDYKKKIEALQKNLEQANKKKCALLKNSTVKRTKVQTQRSGFQFQRLQSQNKTLKEQLAQLKNISFQKKKEQTVKEKSDRVQQSQSERVRNASNKSNSFFKERENQSQPQNEITSDQLFKDIRTVSKLELEQKQSEEDVCSGYKPTIQKLSEIRDLLTYKFTSQRYTYADLKKDIEESGTKTFDLHQIKEMLKIEPFYLNQQMEKTVIQYIFEKEEVEDENQSIATSVFLKKMKKLIKKIKLIPEQEEQEVLGKIAELVSTYPKELESAFESAKNGQGTISKGKFMELFSKLELQEEYIDLLIGELSLCSVDLEHLNYYGFFERFLLEPDAFNQKIEETDKEEQSYEGKFPEDDSEEK